MVGNNQIIVFWVLGFDSVLTYQENVLPPSVWWQNYILVDTVAIG
jgi:hypothetical protein